MWKLNLSKRKNAFISQTQIVFDMLYKWRHILISCGEKTIPTIKQMERFFLGYGWYIGFLQYFIYIIILSTFLQYADIMEVVPAAVVLGC